MGTKVVKNKKTGMMETIEVPDHDPKALADLHKEVKDMIEGNKQFHDDPYAKPKIATENECEHWNGNFCGKAGACYRPACIPKPIVGPDTTPEEDYWYNHIGGY